MWVLGGQQCKSQENLPSGYTDWHQICYTFGAIIIGAYLNGKTLEGSTDKTIIITVQKTDSKKEEGVILYSNVFNTTIVNTKSNTNNIILIRGHSSVT